MELLAPAGNLECALAAGLCSVGADVELLGVLPQDDSVYRCDCDGEPSAKLPTCMTRSQEGA